VLSHAHIDHSGALPLLVRKGYRGPIYATPATRDLCAPMLLDAALLQQADARHIARLIERGEPGIEPVEPLYSQQDVAAVLALMLGLPYRRKQTIAPGVTLSFLDAGHVLGSAVVVLDVDDEGRTTRLAFTGDLGRRHLPILRDPEAPSAVECLLTESTYGDRLHEPIEQMGEALAAAVTRTCARGGKIVIPSFALERAQEVVYELKHLRQAGRIPPVPVFVDSPLTVKPPASSSRPATPPSSSRGSATSPTPRTRRPSTPQRGRRSSSRPAGCARGAASCTTSAPPSETRAIPW
jgi:metallo-beta-lactamase family protein